MRAVRSAMIGLAFVLCLPGVAFAGMPSLLLTDMAQMRVQTISFFAMAFLVSALVIKVLWNYLRSDLPFLPRLTYPKALALVTLWGLIFILVLTMISGARELMTPGAWEKQGKTYRLAQDDRPPAAPAEDPVLRERRDKLHELRLALWSYAVAHGGRFPTDRNVREIPSDFWQLPGPSAMRYVYVGGRSIGEAALPLAYEPEIFEGGRLILLSNGQIQLMNLDELARLGASRR